MEREVAIESHPELEQLVEQAEAGEEVALTRAGHVVARIRPTTTDRSEASDAIQRILEIGSGVSLGGLRFKDLINEGRKY